MTTALKPVTVAPPATRAVIFSVARFETRRALRHPLILIGALGSLWLMWTLGGDVAPILERDSVFLAGAMLPLAAATLLVANYAILRQRGVLETLDAYPSKANHRILGVQLGVIGPVLVAVLLQTIGMVYLLLGGPIGTVNSWELAVGPLLVVVFGLGGVVLGRWLPHPIVAPVALVGLAGLQFMASPDAQIFSSVPTANVEWLAPWMMPSAFSPIEELAFRPSVLHFGYLAVLALVLGILAFHHRGRDRLAPLAVGGLFGVAVVVVSFNLPSEPTTGFEWPEAAENQVCSTADGIEYCAFEFYADWIPRWQETVASVNDLAPVSIDTVMQRPPNHGWDDNSGIPASGFVVLTSLEWDRVGGLPTQGFRLAIDLAQSAVGLPSTPQIRSYTPEEIESIVEQNPGYPGDLRAPLEEEGPYPKACSAIGQARAVVAVWLAGAALAEGATSLQATLTGLLPSATSLHWPDRAHDPSVMIGRPDAELAAELLALPVAEVHSELLSRWPEVMDPATTSADLASWFGLSAPVYPELDFYEAPCR
ncbi:MAG TPA: hypothetical protein VJA46_13775 [Acidimicrobiia bacterium]|nr:hypothetical protein [Acidimicrobiia bacterium]